MTAVLSPVLVLSGCDVMGTAIKKRSLEVKTQMSETIWLEPSSQKTAYLQMKNTSDRDMSGLQAKVTKAVQDKSYTITSSPDSTHRWIQVSVSKVDKMDLCTAQGFLSRGYEDAIVGATLGAGIIGYNFSSAGTTSDAGLAVGLVGMAAGAMVKDISCTMVTDIRIFKKTIASAQTDNVAALEQGTSRYEV